MTNTVRLGLAGLGGIGQHHAADILAGRVPRLELAAVADIDPEKCARYPDKPAYASAEEMVASGKIDALLIATPHRHHPALGLAAIAAGLHVMIEKPLAADKASAERLLAAPRRPGQIVAAMFNQRTDNHFISIRELVHRNELGTIQRIHWTATHWFRTDVYYASGRWRATWAGEGGGLLLNQCAHNLDLFQWIFGMPVRVRAFCGFGRYHPIEVEDDVTAYLEFAQGATAVFTASTGESPGTNRLEVAAEQGRLVYESDRIVFTRNREPASVFARNSPEAFARPTAEDYEIEADGHGGQHTAMLRNFTEAILDGAPLIAPADEGLNSLELANAMLL
jgi:predicted dehydrogenase